MALARRECSVEKSLAAVMCAVVVDRCIRRRAGHRSWKLTTSQLVVSAGCAPNAMVRCSRGIHPLKICCYLQASPSYCRRHCWSPVGTVLCRRCRRLTNSDQVPACSRLGVDTSFLGWLSRQADATRRPGLELVHRTTVSASQQSDQAFAIKKAGGQRAAT